MPDSGNDFLDILRDLQDSQNRDPSMSFEEFNREQELKKAGGRVQFGGAYNPGVGMMGPYGNTSSRAPTGPNSRPSGNQAWGAKQFPQQFGVPSGQYPNNGPSQYSLDVPPQPLPWIDDVDMSSIWYSPMEPVWPFGPPYYNRPREWDFPVGYNLNYIPNRIVMYAVLRSMRRSWGIISTVEATRMDQLLRLPWTIQRKDKPRGTSKAVDQMQAFFKRPDGKNSFAQWSRKILFDLFDIDAPSLYVNRTMDGKPKFIEVIDGATLFPLIDDMGRRPDSQTVITANGLQYIRRQPAFQQIIYGLPMVNLSEDQVMYPIMRPQPDMPMFGYSPVEQIYIEATEGIRKTFYQADFWRAGSIPEMMVSVPEQWTPRQIATFQAHFDALMSGNLSLKSKVRFVPSGMKPHDMKNASGENLWSQRDEMLIRLVCYAFSVSPTPFIKQTNRSTAQNAQQSAQEEGLYPLMSWFKDDIMDHIIQGVFGFDDIEFVYLPRPETDAEKQSKIHQTQIDEGLRPRNEVREELGLEPIEGGDVVTITTGAGVMPLSMAITGQHFAIGSGAQGGDDNNTGQQTAGKKPKNEPRNGNVGNNKPQRGTARPIDEASGRPSPINKVDAGQLDQAQREAKGHLPDFSHTKLHIGNYPKGHVWIDGLNVSIENAPGSLRGEKDEKGVKWQVKMPAAYGYIRGTIGADNEAIDCYIGKDAASKTVWVIDQNRVSKKGKIKDFDEHKVFLCYKSAKKALKDYLKTHFNNYGHERMENMVEMSIDEFKYWLKNGKMKKPIAEQGVGEIVLKQKDLEKADTISSATGLSGYSYLSSRKVRKRKTKKELRRKRGSQWMELVA